MAERTVELAVDAEPELVPVVRNVAADLAIRMDLQLDTIADLRLAVDEACGLLLQRAATPTTLRVRFSFGDSSVTARAEIACRDGTSLPQEGFHWHVLTALVRSVRSAHTTGAGGEPLAVIELTVAD
ncbi:ATP-binding protein [Saccharomonospora piscinae]|uniref:ATP-binding protein n=1 Tax=Saccharomonospora piscinae TaxID=687388 RepID=UPI001106660C|nr:ATP-binding protein [Saccharomonospora piscinae]TLW91811.1 ATP-binding protein [Saccharomonospora piscinae]